MNAVLCPKGHESSEADYCSECGVKIGSAGGARNGFAEPAGAGNGTHAGPGAGSAVAERCPDCGTMRETRDVVFCEICGYNFDTGAHGGGGMIAAEAQPGITAPPPPMPPIEEEPQASGGDESVNARAEGTAPEGTAPEGTLNWVAEVTADPALREPGSPEPPAGVGPFSFPLTMPVSLIGRRSEARAIFPEIPLSYDDAVSHRHALLQLAPDGVLTLRDIGATNGTRLNGAEVAPMADVRLKDGDEITLGHWTRIRIKQA